MQLKGAKDYQQWGTKTPRGSIPIVSSWKPSSRERTTTGNGWSGTGKIDAHRLTRYRIQRAWRIHRPGNCGGDYRQCRNNPSSRYHRYRTQVPTMQRMSSACSWSLMTNAGQTGSRVIKGTNHWVWDRTIPKSVSSCNWKIRLLVFFENSIAIKK